MFYKKSGIPEVWEIVVCTVKRVLPTSVFVILDEYKNLEGMLHISEVSAGRIRNIRDYVKEGKRVVCKVIRVNPEKGHIDLSLRRVNKSQYINKISEYKQEQKSEKLLEGIGKELNKSLEDIYKEVGYSLIEKYGSLNQAFQKIVLDPDAINELKITKKTREILEKTIKEKIKPPEVSVQGILTLQTNEPRGIEIVKKILSKIQKGTIKISYLGAPNYKISVTASDYKTAEGILKNAQEEAIKEIEANKGTGSFTRK